MAKLVINAERKLSHINKELQGHFSEHLGRCIYEGLYVGENSEIPNVNGMRTDVVEALKQIRSRYFAGRADVSMTNITGKTASDRKKEERKSSTPTGAAW